MLFNGLLFKNLHRMPSPTNGGRGIDPYTGQSLPYRRSSGFSIILVPWRCSLLLHGTSYCILCINAWMAMNSKIGISRSSHLTFVLSRRKNVKIKKKSRMTVVCRVRWCRNIVIWHKIVCACGGIHPGRVEPASPREKPVSR